MAGSVVLLAQLLFVLSVSSQIYRVTPTWSFDQAQLDQFTAAARKTSNDTWLYHWGDIWSGMKACRAGFIDQQELDYMNNGTGVGGGGYYMSNSKTDSSSHGHWCTAIYVPKGTILISSGGKSEETTKLVKLLGGPIPLPVHDKVQLGRVIPFIDYYYDFERSWSVTHHSKILGKILPSYRAPEPFTNSLGNGVKTFRSSVEYELANLQQDIARRGDGRWNESFAELRSMLPLLRYMGPLEANCRARNGENLWEGTNTTYYQNYVKLLKWSEGLDDNQSFGFGSNGIWGQLTRTPLQWAQNLTRVLLPQLYRMVHGNMTSDDMIWRNEEKTGHKNNQGVQVTGSQLKTLQLNPYLTVQVLHLNKTGRSWVKWWYPDVFHYNSSLISNETKTLLMSYPREKISQNVNLRHRLNTILLQDMTEQMLLGIYNQSTSRYDSLALQQRLSYIMPAADSRVLSVWEWLGERELGSGSLSSDTDFPNLEVLVQADTFKYLQRLHNDVLVSMGMSLYNSVIYSLYNNKTTNLSDYNDAWKEYDQYGHEGMSFLSDMNWKFSVKDCTLIRNQNWAELFDSLNPTWQDYGN